MWGWMEARISVWTACASCVDAARPGQAKATRVLPSARSYELGSALGTHDNLAQRKDVIWVQKSPTLAARSVLIWVQISRRTMRVAEPAQGPWGEIRCSGVVLAWGVGAPGVWGSPLCFVWRCGCVLDFSSEVPLSRG